MNARFIDVIPVAHRLIQVHLAVKPHEEVLLVADPETDLEMAQALAGAVEAAGAEFTLAVMPSRTERRATELTRVIERGLEGADVLIGLNRTAGAPTYAARVTELLAARRLRQILEQVPGADHVAEIGLGLNPNALHNDDFEEEKKAAGNVHVALGSDLFYGGDHSCAVHMDMVIRAATFRVDGVPLFVDGRLQGGLVELQADPGR